MQNFIFLELLHGRHTFMTFFCFSSRIKKFYYVTVQFLRITLCALATGKWVFLLHSCVYILYNMKKKHSHVLEIPVNYHGVTHVFSNQLTKSQLVNHNCGKWLQCRGNTHRLRFWIPQSWRKKCYVHICRNIFTHPLHIITLLETESHG